jgi:hypothetical protein
MQAGRQGFVPGEEMTHTYWVTRDLTEPATNVLD